MRGKSAKLTPRALELFARRVLVFLAAKKRIACEFSRADVGVFFLKNSEMRALKREHLKKDADFVDVLSFPSGRGFPEPPGAPPFLGEVFINRAFARKPPGQGRYFLIHGLLHLLGYGHAKKSDNIRMREAEELLASEFNAIPPK